MRLSSCVTAASKWLFRWRVTARMARDLWLARECRARLGEKASPFSAQRQQPELALSSDPGILMQAKSPEEAALTRAARSGPACLTLMLKER